MQKGLEDTSNILGREHPLTAQLNVDVARALLRVDHREEAIKFLEKAYEIYATTEFNDNIEKAEIANQIATLLNEFNSHLEAIEFAEKSNLVFDKKGEKYISKVMLNNKIIAEAKSKLGDYEDAIKRADALYNNVTNPSIWNTSLGCFVVDSVKISFEAMLRDEGEYKGIKHTMFFILDMIKDSTDGKPATDDDIEQLKTICEANKFPSSLLRAMLSDIMNRPEIYNIDSLVNVDIDKFVRKLPSHQKQNAGVIEKIMRSLALIFKCVGGEFLLEIVKPLT